MLKLKSHGSLLGHAFCSKSRTIDNKDIFVILPKIILWLPNPPGIFSIPRIDHWMMILFFNISRKE